MTIEEIQAALAELVAAMVEKCVPRPKADFTIKPFGEKHYVFLSAQYKYKAFDGDSSRFCRGDTVVECLDAARAYIDALPSPEEAVTREYLTRVASAVDYATEHSLPDEYVAPLRGVSAAMTSNLLTKETA